MKDLYKLKCIGSGCLTNCYQHPEDDSKVILRTKCPIKKMMAEEKLPESSLFPTIKIIEENLYEMDKLVLGSYDDDDPVYRELYRLGMNDRGQELYEALERMDLQDSIKETIILGFLALYEKYEDVRLDTMPYNVGRDKTGSLVLFDIFFSRKAFDEACRKDTLL